MAIRIQGQQSNHDEDKRSDRGNGQVAAIEYSQVDEEQRPATTNDADRLACRRRSSGRRTAPRRLAVTSSIRFDFQSLELKRGS